MTDEDATSVDPSDLAPLWHAMGEHVETLRQRACALSDDIATLAALRSMLNALYDLTEVFSPGSGG